MDFTGKCELIINNECGLVLKINKAAFNEEYRPINS